MTDFTIDVRDLRKSFGARKVVDGLTLQLGRGEICGFLGANGSYDGMYAVVLSVAFLGFAADRLYLLISKRTLAWRD